MFLIEKKTFWTYFYVNVRHICGRTSGQEIALESVRLTVWHITKLGGEMLLSDSLPELSRLFVSKWFWLVKTLSKKIFLSGSLSNLIRHLMRKWFFQNHSMTCQVSWWHLVGRWFLQTHGLSCQDSCWLVMALGE